jgi:hypothetical protein
MLIGQSALSMFDSRKQLNTSRRLALVADQVIWALRQLIDTEPAEPIRARSRRRTETLDGATCSKRGQ